MKILIVDDEMLVRAGLKSIIDWERHGYTIIGEADSGDKALKMVKELKPDIMFLDINMPGTNGIDVLKGLKESRDACKVIVISCHDEFEYVKEAMKLGALEYILKHRIIPANILCVLDNVKRLIEDENKNKENAIMQVKGHEKELIYQKKDFFERIFKGIQLTEWELNGYINCCKLKIQQRNLSCIVFEVNDLEKVKQRYVDNNENLLHIAINNILEELLLNEPESEFVNFENNKYVVLLSNFSERSEYNIYKRNTYIVNKLRNALNNYLNITTSYGISGKYDGFSNTSVALRQALMSLSQKFLYPDSHIFLAKDISFENEFVSKLLFDAENTLIANIEKNDFYNSLISLRETCNKLISNKKYVNIDQLKKFLFRSVAFISNSFLGGERLLFEAENIDNINHYLNILGQAEEIYQKQCLFSLSQKNHLVRKAIKYIDDNYYKDINLNDISRYLCVSGCYLSRLFNKEMNTTISNYINDKRIEKSKELLKNTTLKTYEIAEKVGFKNSVHFNIVFKKLVKCTPTEYRNRVL